MGEKTSNAKTRKECENSNQYPQKYKGTTLIKK